MPKTSQADRVKMWHERIGAAKKAKTKWEDRFRPDRLEEYYEGIQWADTGKELSEQPYVINLVYPSIEIRKPSLLFYHPVVRITPKPAKLDDPGSTVEARAKLQSDMVNTFISDRRLNFKPETTLSLHETFFRFGVVEVGYTGDFIDNPDAGKPMLDEDGEVQAVKGAPVMAPDKIPQSETLFIKRIPAKQFLVSVSSRNILTRNDWCGYFEWHYIEDIKRNQRYKNTASLKSSGRIDRTLDDAIDTEEDRDADGNNPHRDMIKVWKIWDLRTKTKLVIPDVGEKFFVEGEPFRFLPFAALKPHERLDSWYPLPPVFNWIHPQNELNETREMQRIHRRRMPRRHLANEAFIDPDEAKKLESVEDGTVAWCRDVNNAFAPVQDAPLDGAIARNIPQSKEDFQQVSGIGDNQRAESNPGETATEANIIEMRGRIRESFQRMQVGEWLAEIAWLMLETIKDNMALPMLVRVSVDPLGPNALEETLRVAQIWKQVTAEDLGDIQHDISVDLQSLSPVSEEAERQSWSQVLALLTNLPLLTVLASSEVLLRKTLSYYNIKSENEIREIRKAATAVVQMAAMQAQAAAQAKGAGGAQGAPSPGPTPSNMDIQGQLQEQMGGVQ